LYANESNRQSIASTTSSTPVERRINDRRAAKEKNKAHFNCESIMQKQLNDTEVLNKIWAEVPPSPTHIRLARTVNKSLYSRPLSPHLAVFVQPSPLITILYPFKTHQPFLSQITSHHPIIYPNN